MKLKTGKAEIVYLLDKVFEKYEAETGEQIVRNTNRKNYEGVARRLSEISNQLPGNAVEWEHENYSPDYNPKKLDYPFRKYDITSSQIKDAFFGVVSNPRSFLVDSCYIYLFGVGRAGFEKAPRDPNLLFDETTGTKDDGVKTEQELLRSRLAMLETEHEKTIVQNREAVGRQRRVWMITLVFLLLALAFTCFQWYRNSSRWQIVKKDMNILPYQPTAAEIDSLEGVWLCYTGSPQARSSDPNRYHMVVSNVVDVRYKNGYFTFTRYGASFDHTGYMQFEAPWLVSIHSYVKNSTDSIESPRHSLMRLNREKPFVPVISASWNFDVGSRNNVIGIREVYIRQGKGGEIEEVMNTIENASCHCKIIRWRQGDHAEKSFHLRNEPLDSLPEPSLKRLLDEKSILLRVPEEGLILGDTSKPVQQ